MDEHKVQLDLGSFSDMQLADEVKKGNEAAFEEISDRYRGLISSIAARYSAAGIDHADLMQEGLLALLSACKAYDNREDKASFRNFAGVCISNRFLSVIRSASTKSAIPRDRIIPIEDVDISDQNQSNPETLMLQKESSRDFAKLIKDRLSPLEMNVLRLYLGGMSYAEISGKLNVSAKSVDNALQRIRKKLAQQ